EDHEGGGRFFIALGDGAEAEMTYVRQGRDVIMIDHTFTPPEFRGRDIAMQLMLRAIAEARSGGLRIVPACSYVAAQFRRHPEWADLLACRRWPMQEVAHRMQFFLDDLMPAFMPERRGRRTLAAEIGLQRQRLRRRADRVATPGRDQDAPVRKA